MASDITEEAIQERTDHIRGQADAIVRATLACDDEALVGVLVNGLARTQLMLEAAIEVLGDMADRLDALEYRAANPSPTRQDRGAR